MAEIVRSYIGLGKVHGRAAGSTGKFRHLGNVSVLGLQHQVATQRQPDFTRSGGGTAVRVDRVEQVNVSMTWLTFSPDNWAVATAGTKTDVAAATSTTQTVKLYKGATTPLAAPPNAIASVTNVGATVTYDVGDDWVKSGGGVYVPDDSGITDGADHVVTYTALAYARIEGAMGAATDLELWFEGLNEADSDRPVLVNLWQVKVPSAEEIALIGTELGQFTFAAECIKDSTKGAGVSAFYRALLVQPPAA
jgi:hypothetical protein